MSKSTIICVLVLILLLLSSVTLASSASVDQTIVTSHRITQNVRKRIVPVSITQSIEVSQPQHKQQQQQQLQQLQQSQQQRQLEAAPSTSTTGQPIVQPADLPIHINTGGVAADWIDTKSQFKWIVDHQLDTKQKSKDTKKTDIIKSCGGTNSDTVGCTYQMGTIVYYSIRVLESRERYKITFTMLEPVYTVANARLLDIYVEGVLTKSKIDPYVLAGNTINKLVNVTIVLLNERGNDGFINIMIKPSITTTTVPVNGNNKDKNKNKDNDNSIQKAIRGIYVELSPYRLVNDFPLRINSGSSVSWIDPATNYEWLPDTDYDRPTLRVNDCNGNTKVTNPLLKDNNQLYCTYRMGSIINYSIRVLDIAERYKVTLYMVEPSFVGKNQRMMDIFIENKLVYSKLDIVNYTGTKNKPAIVTITTTGKILDGIINIKLKSSSGKASTGQKVIISGIIVERI